MKLFNPVLQQLKNVKDMLTYKYKAVTTQGNIERGYISAENIQQLKESFIEENKTLLYLIPELHLMKKSVSTKKWVHLFHHLKLLLTAGLPLLQALEECQSILDNSYLRTNFEELCTQIKRGKSFSTAINLSHLNFPHIVSHIITLAEKTGNLQLSIESIYQHLFWQEQFKTTLMQALRYPLFLICVFSCVFYFLSNHVAPQIFEFLQTLKGDTHQTENFMILNQGIRYVLWVMGYSLCGLISLYVLSPLSNISLLLRDRFLYKIPLINAFLLTRFFQTFSICIQSHIDVIQALDLARQSTKNTYFQHQCEKVKKDLEQGQSLQQAFANSLLFPSSIIRLLRLGDMTGYLENIAQRLALFLEQQFKNNMDTLIAYLQPFLILCLGFFLLFLVGGLIYPLYEHLSILT